MDTLNLPSYSFKIQIKEQRKLIFDSIRKKFVVLTPEEWVRQNFIRYLIEEKLYSPGLIAVEQGIKINRNSQRSDIILYSNNGIPLMIVECKSVKINITQSVFDQVARYNMDLKVPFLVVTNGLRHFCCKMDYENQTYSFMREIPLYSDIKTLL